MMTVTEFKMGFQKLKSHIVTYHDYKCFGNEKFKVRRYQQRIEQFRQNRIFDFQDVRRI